MVITFYQQDIAWGNPEANRRDVEAAIAAAPKSDLFVVPETFTTGFGDHMASLAEPPEGSTLQWAIKMAAQHDLLFVGTWIVREGDRCFNRLHWVYPTGEYGTYDKGHTFRVSGEADQIARGTRREVFEWRGWHIKPAVCYDLRFPKWLRNDNMAYDLLLVCANWPGSRHEAWTTLLKARAIENLSYVVGCNREGTDSTGIPYAGCSAIVDFKGNPLAALPPNPPDSDTTPQSVTLSATLSATKLARFREKWPFNLDFD